MAINGKGRITAANASAAALWQLPANELLDQAFASLFQFEVTSNDPEFLEAQWDVLVGSALNQTMPLTAQPRDGAPRDVRLRLEQSSTDGYLATIQPPAALAKPTATTGALDDRGAALELLAAHGTAGFFDLNLAAGRYQFSPAWKKLLGYTAGELPDTLESWDELILPVDSADAPE